MTYPRNQASTCTRHKCTLAGGALLAIAASFIATPAAAKPRPQRARNVIVFLGDAGGLPTLNAAGILAHDRPQSLFIQSMPHVGLSDTSSTDRWVTDSAAGMTAIMTGQKTAAEALASAEALINPILDGQ